MTEHPNESTVTVTRHFSGFANIEDRLQLGDHEADGNAAATLYVLPTGYHVIDGYFVDPAGYIAIPVLADGTVTLTSVRGPHPDTPLRPA